MAKTTPKQQQVLDRLKKGQSVEQVAKAMKITTSGVYGHMRRMRNDGVKLPGETPSPRTETVPTAAAAIKRAATRAAAKGSTTKASAKAATRTTSAPTNGLVLDVDVIGTIKRAIKQNKESMLRIGGEVKDLRAAAELMEAQLASVTTQTVSYQDALAGLESTPSEAKGK